MAMKWTWKAYRRSRYANIALVVLLVALVCILIIPVMGVLLILAGVIIVYHDWRNQKRFWLERHPSCEFRDLQIAGNPYAETACQEWQRGTYYDRSLMRGEPYKCKFCEFRTFVPATELR
jgi:hypothetical protein